MPAYCPECCHFPRERLDLSNGHHHRKQRIRSILLQRASKTTTAGDLCGRLATSVPSCLRVNAVKCYAVPADGVQYWFGALWLADCGWGSQLLNCD